MLSVSELIFRGKDRIRPSWRVFSIVGLVLIARVIFGHVGVVGVCWLAGSTAVVVGLSVGAALRSWTRVGPAGITICWGIGRRGRTFPWQEIRWIDVWESRGAHVGGAAQMTLANGRRLRLPALASTSAYPQPTFAEDFAASRRLVGVQHRSSRTVPATADVANSAGALHVRRDHSSPHRGRHRDRPGHTDLAGRTVLSRRSGGLLRRRVRGDAGEPQARRNMINAPAEDPVAEVRAAVQD